MLAFLMILFSAWHHADSPFCLYLYGQSPLTCQVFQAPGTKQDSPSISVLHCVGLLTWLYFLGAQSQEIPLSVCFWDLAKLSGFPSQNRFLSLSLMVGVCLPRKAFLAPSGKHIPLSVFVLDGGGGICLPGEAYWTLGTKQIPLYVSVFGRVVCLPDEAFGASSTKPILLFISVLYDAGPLTWWGFLVSWCHVNSHSASDLDVGVLLARTSFLFPGSK